MANYFAWFDYFFNELKIKNPVEPAYKALWETHRMDLIYSFDDICIVSQNPIAIRRKGNTLHHDSLPAIDYGGYEQYWFLNGVRVTKELIETPWNKIDSKIILKEKNAEVRREIVRKCGIEKICKDLGASVRDKQGDYELLVLNIGDNRQRPYLKMVNPSIGCYHIEGVHPSCDTVEKALNWRCGDVWNPVVLT
jgi:hypothetical protein